MGMSELIWAQIIVTIISGAVTGGASLLLLSLRERMKAKEKSEADEEQQKRLIREGLQAILRQQICEQAKLGLRIGSATIKDKEIMEMTYKPYHNLGGNGVVTELYEAYMSLPITE